MIKHCPWARSSHDDDGETWRKISCTSFASETTLRILTRDCNARVAKVNSLLAAAKRSHISRSQPIKCAIGNASFADYLPACQICITSCRCLQSWPRITARRPFAIAFVDKCQRSAWAISVGSAVVKGCYDYPRLIRDARKRVSLERIPLCNYYELTLFSASSYDAISSAIIATALARYSSRLAGHCVDYDGDTRH